MVEQEPFKLVVVGSIPTQRTKKQIDVDGLFLYLELLQHFYKFVGYLCAKFAVHFGADVATEWFVM